MPSDWIPPPFNPNNPADPIMQDLRARAAWSARTTTWEAAPAPNPVHVDPVVSPAPAPAPGPIDALRPSSLAQRQAQAIAAAELDRRQRRRIWWLLAGLASVAGPFLTMAFIVKALGGNDTPVLLQLVIGPGCFLWLFVGAPLCFLRVFRAS